VVIVSAALLVPVLAACNHMPLIGTRADKDRTPAAERLPEVPALVKYLNDNASRVQAVECTSLGIDCTQGSQKVGVSGKMVCQKPRNFRLRADLLGSSAADIGSNSEEFWYWISKATPPHVYHCSYHDLATKKVNVPFPFHPDMVVTALGMASYDANAEYKLNAPPRANYLELVQQTTSPHGQPVQRVTVFARTKQEPPHPQVIAHVLKDMSGKLICRASIRKVRVDRATGVALPTDLTIEWPEQKLSMTLLMPDVRSVNNLPVARSQALFQRGDLARYTSFDLGRMAVDGPGAIRRAGATALPGPSTR
jgi:hypothetical protein